MGDITINDEQLELLDIYIPRDRQTLWAQSVSMQVGCLFAFIQR